MIEIDAGKYSDIAISQRIGTYEEGVSPDLLINKVRPDCVENNVVHDINTILTKIKILCISFDVTRSSIRLSGEMNIALLSNDVDNNNTNLSYNKYLEHNYLNLPYCHVFLL